MFFCQILFPSKIIITFSKVAIYSVLDSFGKYNAHMKLIVSECKTLYFQQLITHDWTETIKKRTTFFLKERKCFQRKLHQLILDCFHKLGVYVQEKNEFLHCKTMLHFWQEYYVIWSETARVSKMPCILFCFFFRPVPSCRKYCISWDGCVCVCVFFNEIILHVYMWKTFQEKWLVRKTRFYWTESGTLWDESACWKVCFCQLFVYSRKNPLIFIILKKITDNVLIDFFRLAEKTKSWFFCWSYINQAHLLKGKSRWMRFQRNAFRTGSWGNRRS